MHSSTHTGAAQRSHTSRHRQRQTLTPIHTAQAVHTHTHTQRYRQTLTGGQADNIITSTLMLKSGRGRTESESGLGRERDEISLILSPAAHPFIITPFAH